MSHDLVQSGSQTSFVNAGARKSAWHGLGIELPEMITGEQALEFAHLDYLVEKLPQTVTVLGDNDFETITSPDVAMVRRNPYTGRQEIVGTAKPSYEVIQNHEWIPFMDTIVAESGAHYTTAGELNSGSKVFISLKLPEGIKVGGVDQVDSYLVIGNSHDANSAAMAFVSPIRVVCGNTYGFGLRSAPAKFTLRHTVNVRDRMALARTALGVTVTYLEEFASMADAMLDTPVSAAEFEALTDKIWTPKDHSKDKTTRGATMAAERKAMLRFLFVNAPTNEIGRNTAWGALNAVTEYTDHFWSADATRNAIRVTDGGAEISKIKAKALALLS